MDDHDTHTQSAWKHRYTLWLEFNGQHFTDILYAVSVLKMFLFDLRDLPIRIYYYKIIKMALIARFMGPTWGPAGANRIQVGPMLPPWTLLSGTGANKMALLWMNVISVNLAKLISHHFVWWYWLQQYTGLEFCFIIVFTMFKKQHLFLPTRWGATLCLFFPVWCLGSPLIGLNIIF